MNTTPEHGHVITERQLRRLDKAIDAQMRIYAQCRRHLKNLDPATIALGVEVLGSETAVVQWLCAPAFGLGGEIPLKMMRSAKGREQVAEILAAIQYGVFQ